MNRIEDAALDLFKAVTSWLPVKILLFIMFAGIPAILMLLSIVAVVANLFAA